MVAHHPVFPTFSSSNAGGETPRAGFSSATQTSLTPLSLVVYNEDAFPHMFGPDLGRRFHGCT